jgi:hypothetical protein
MMRQKRLFGLALATIAIAVLVSACGGGGVSGGGNGGGGNNGGGTSPTVAVAVQGAVWVAYQDGANGTWRTLAPSGGFSGSVPSTAPDGRYSLAFVCPEQKPTVHVVHATRQELPSVTFTCGGTTPATITVSGTVSGLNGGNALVSIGEATTTTAGGYSVQAQRGFHDVIAVRYTGSAPNRVWLQRNRQFSNNTTYNIDFSQDDGTLVRVFDVEGGTLTVSGLDPLANETATVYIYLQSGRRSSFVGIGSTLNELTPIAYPRFPPDALSAAEQFRVIVDTTEQRGVVQVASTLPNSLTVTLPPPYVNPTLSVNSAGAIQFTAQDFSYGETAVVGYQLSASASSGARYEYFITAGWLGNANAYTTPVLETLAGWNSAWSLQRGETTDVSLRVYISPSGATPQAVWSYLQGNPAPSGFLLRYATRRQTLTP